MATRFVCPCFVCKHREAFHVTSYVAGAAEMKQVAVCDPCYNNHALSNGAPADEIIGFGPSVELGHLILQAWDSESSTTTEEEQTASSQEGSDVGSDARNLNPT